MPLAAAFSGALVGWAGANAAMNLYAARLGEGDHPSQDTRRPSWFKFIREIPAGVRLLAAQFGPVPFSQPGLGKGRAVLVVPGFLADDLPTGLLRRTFSACGFTSYGWAQGYNLGARSDILAKLEERLERIISETGGPVALIGWSLGGLYVRELAKRRAADVSLVITLGTPFSVNLRDNNAWKLCELLNDHPVDNPPIPFALNVKPPVMTFAIWSIGDGIVAPASAGGTEAEADGHIRLSCSHNELVSHPEALAAIVDIFRDEDKRTGQGSGRAA